MEFRHSLAARADWIGTALMLLAGCAGAIYVGVRAALAWPERDAGFHVFGALFAMIPAYLLTILVVERWYVWSTL